ncbi:MAG: carboxymuconolactone decarboxylase family protein [Burkholderiaceae bacterium]|jgi:alkylhydroperoxidase family enzyme
MSSRPAPRVAPLEPPYPIATQEAFDAIMKGRAPLTLFRTVARDERLLQRFLAGGLLDRGNLSLRQREIVIGRTTALCKSEYEWGVHMAIYGARAAFTESERYSLVHGIAQDACWTSPAERALIDCCDALTAHCDIEDALWSQLGCFFSEQARLEVLMLAGQYRTVSYLTNALALPLEDFAMRFPTKIPL